jgi:hypothetical protein
MLRPRYVIPSLLRLGEANLCATALRLQAMITALASSVQILSMAGAQLRGSREKQNHFTTPTGGRVQI